MAERLIVFAPHQDDELLHCAGTLWKAAREHAQVKVCFLTNGEYEGEAFAAIRKQESEAVLKALGLPKDTAVFLGYADTGMPPEKSFLTRLLQEDKALSQWGRTQTWLPNEEPEYHMVRFGCHADYTKACVLQDITTLLEEFMPDEVYVTAEFDRHGDHAAAAKFVKQAIVQSTCKPKLFEYLVHAADETAWPPRTGAYVPPKDKTVPWHKHQIRPLPEGFTAADKYKLLSSFQSQKPEAYGGFLLSFAKKEELLFSD